jgi:flagellar biosynthesis/type III secretory pathway M-ring protein FliF/YscJ
MDTDRVTIVDSSGLLLTSTIASGKETALLARDTDERKKKAEIYLKTSLTSLLEKITGEGNVNVTVDAHVDDDQLQTEEEIFDPDSQVITSSNYMTDAYSSVSKLTRDDAVTIDNSIHPSTVQNHSANTFPMRTTTHDIKNYSTSKKVIRRVRLKEHLSRISVAVLLNASPDLQDGGTSSTHLTTEETLEKVDRLVKASIGYDAGRGDSVSVISLPFRYSDLRQSDSQQDIAPPRQLDRSPPAMSWAMFGIGFAIIFIMFSVWYYIRKTLHEPSFGDTAEKNEPMPSEALSRPSASDGQSGLITSDREPSDSAMPMTMSSAPNSPRARMARSPRCNTIGQPTIPAIPTIER